jgi:hypothetical protein
MKIYKKTIFKIKFHQSDLYSPENNFYFFIFYETLFLRFRWMPPERLKGAVLMNAIEKKFV